MLTSPALLAQGSWQHVAVDLTGPPDVHVKSVGDLNGDGFPDLVAGGTLGALYWYEERSAHPDWTRHVVTSGGLGGWSTDAECGDVDGDGDEDIVVSDWYQAQRIDWFENLDGAGGSFAFHPIGAPHAHDLELADFDGDGDLDVVTRLQQAEGKPLEFWRNDAAGATWVHATFQPPTAVAGEGLHVADLDADGDPDVVLGYAWYENLHGAFPPGNWSEHLFVGTAIDPDTFPFAADIDGDGRLDVVTTPSESAGGYDETRWFRAPPDPRDVPWEEHVIDASVETVTHSLGVADMDLDGDLDVVTAEMEQSADPDEVRVYTNEDGAGRVWTRTVIDTGGSHSIRLLDIGRDGDVDVFGANWTGTTRVDVWENTLRAPRVGAPFCIGLQGCPCGNAGAAGEGCANSTGQGAGLAGFGTTSVAADDLELVAAPFAPGQLGLVLMASGEGSATVADGRLCLAGGLFRFPPGSTGGAGALVAGPGLASHAAAHFPPAGQIVAGATWRFQAWCRDHHGPCGGGSNFSAGLAVTFTP